MNEHKVSKEALFSTLPKTEFINDLDKQIEAAIADKIDTIIVLDDDPTGTQTVYDVPVLTQWDIPSVESELKIGTPLFYILTNSRALVEKEAIALALEIGNNINKASSKLEKKCLVISRSDSTLRGHYPAEVKALMTGLGLRNAVQFIIPAFFEGGRYTINDIHYVQEGDQLIPAGLTPFAQDKVFGYQNSNLIEWVKEKNEEESETEKIKSLSLNDLRTEEISELAEKINTFGANDVCIVNAAEYQDLQRFVAAVFRTEITALFRTAASFVAAIRAKPFRPLLKKEELNVKGSGGLIIVGSYVPKSTAQLRHLLEELRPLQIEIDVAKLIEGKLTKANDLSEQVNHRLQAGEMVVLSTSRKLVSADSDKDSLDIGKVVSRFLTDIVAGVTVRPQFILAKGGITSSDIATQSLRVKRAVVKGQIIAGVPIWELEEGSKFPGLAYIVFPGNVGDESSLTDVVRKMH